MAIAPLQIPQLGAVSALDFSGLEKLGEQIRQGRIDDMRRAAIQQYGQGNPQALLQSGDLQLANLYAMDKQRTEAGARDVRDFAFRQEEAARSQSNTDRGFGLQSRAADRADDPTPEGFRKKPDVPGAVEPIPGGPKDPQYILDTVKPRQMSVTDIGKLTEEGTKFAGVTRFTETFKPEYGGNLITGSLPNVAGRYLPESIAGKTRAEAATWWQDYDRHAGIVRNELFGATLTPGEQANWDKFDINPRMDPKAIQANLKARRDIEQRGVQRKAEALVAQGYDPEVIGKAYGLKVQGRVGRNPQPTQAPATGAVGSGGAVDWKSYFGGR